MSEFCENVDLRLCNKRVVESLIKAGAFDFLLKSRARLFAGVDSILDAAARRVRERESGQANLFGGPEEHDGGGTTHGDHLPDVPPWSDRETLAGEKETLGFYVTGHPLAPFAEELSEICTHTTSALAGADAASEVTVGGMVTGLKRRKTKKGDLMATFNLEDLEGSAEVVVFPDLYARSMSKLTEDAAILVTGRPEIEDRARILATSIATLQQARESRTTGVAIQIVTTGLTDEILEQLKTTLADHKGSVPLYLEVARPGGFVMTLKADPISFGTSPSKEMMASVEALLGKGSVRLRARQARSVS